MVGLICGEVYVWWGLYVVGLICGKAYMWWGLYVVWLIEAYV